MSNIEISLVEKNFLFHINIIMNSENYTFILMH